MTDSKKAEQEFHEWMEEQTRESEVAKLYMDGEIWEVMESTIKPLNVLAEILCAELKRTDEDALRAARAIAPIFIRQIEDLLNVVGELDEFARDRQEKMDRVNGWCIREFLQNLRPDFLDDAVLEIIGRLKFCSLTKASAIFGEVSPHKTLLKLIAKTKGGEKKSNKESPSEV